MIRYVLVLVFAIAVPVVPFSQAVRADAARDSLVLTFAGDVMHHDLTARMDDYERLYDAVRPYLSADDLSFANIEFPVDPDRAGSGYPQFNGSVRYVEAAIGAGLDVFSLANNHAFDLGVSGVRATSGVFDSLAADRGITVNGLRSAAGAPIAPSVIRRGDTLIGFVAITSFSNEPGSSPYVNMVDYTDEPVRTAFLTQIAEWDTEFDLLVVSVHAGTEYTSRPDPVKAAFYRSLVAQGADIVWGHHPHVLQPWELVEAGTATKLIIYSAGNFISAQRRLQQPFMPFGRWAPTGDVALFQVTVAPVDSPGGTAPGELSVVHVRTPMFTSHVDPETGLYPASFGTLLTEPLPLAWRAFYLARFASTHALLREPLRSLLVRASTTAQR